jgi:NADH:ubiquinone oxidoreductase subunit 2 (subunit N)
VSVLSCYYYVRLLVILYFTLNNWFPWVRIMDRHGDINLGKLIPMAISLFITSFILLSPNWVIQVSHESCVSLYF